MGFDWYKCLLTHHTDPRVLDSDALKHSAASSQMAHVGCGYPLFDVDGRYLLNGHLLLEFDALNYFDADVAIVDVIGFLLTRFDLDFLLFYFDPRCLSHCSASDYPLVGFVSG